MALITCPECEKQVSDRASSCPHCGCPISGSSGENNIPNTSPQPAPSPAKKSKKSVMIPVIALLIIIAVGAGLYVFMFSPEANRKKAYGEALELYDNGNYSDALTQFEALGEYSNAIDFVVSCKYELGMDAMEISDWETAVSYFSEIAYNDSAELFLQCKYNQGIAAMESFDWENAVSFFTDLNYEDSEKMLTDCSFMIALEESVLHRMEMANTNASDDRALVTTELAYLEDFRGASFYDPTIGNQARKYFKGLDTQLSGLSYDYYYEYQRDWFTGLVARYEALNALYQDYQFLADNKDFIGEYINQLEYHQRWLSAFNALEANGLNEVDWYFADSYVEITFKNNTSHTFSPAFDFMFYGDENESQHLGTTTAYVNDVGPYAEYTVRAYYPANAQSAYYSSGIWVHWYNYYQEIKIK